MTNFVGYANLGLGTNTVAVVATDYSVNQNSQTNTYQLVVTNNGQSETISYDLDGNQTAVVTTTSTNLYGWDAANRLVSITGPTNQSLFTYDGMGRRTQIVELQNGVSVATNNLIWDGQALAEQRDNTGTNVTKRFFGQGEQVAGANYYFTRDHLGSVREVTDATGTMQARYDYDPYGRQTLLAGTAMADFGYAGMYLHSPSGLNLTLYRAYNSDTGRWLNQDPIQEAGGLNLFDYAENNPVAYVDPFGLDMLDALQSLSASGYQQGGILGSAEGIVANLGTAALDTIGAQTVKSLSEQAGAQEGCGNYFTAAGLLAADSAFAFLSAVSFGRLSSIEGFELQFTPDNFYLYEQGSVPVSSEVFSLIEDLNPVQRASAIQDLKSIGINTAPSVSTFIKVILTTTPTPAAAIASIGLISGINYYSSH